MKISNKKIKFPQNILVLQKIQKLFIPKRLNLVILNH